jgi:uncharacterized small protein (DUF1192 family)
MALATLSIDLEARLAGLQQGMDKAARLAEKDSQRMERAFSRVASVAAGIGAALAAAVSVRQVTDWVKGSIDAADAAAKQARQVGLLTEEITALNYAADLSGVSQDELTAALIKLSKVASDAADGIKAPAEMFDRLGVSVKRSDGTLKNTSEILDEVADRFAALPDGIAKTNAAAELFGSRSGAKLISLLNGGSIALADMKREAEQLGLVIGGDFASNSEKLNDNLSRLQKNIDGVANVLAARLVPAFNAVIERVLAATKTFSGFGEFISVSLGAKAFSNEADGVAFYTQRVAELGQEIARLKASGGLLDSLQISGAEKDLDKARKLLEFYQRVASAQGTLGAGGGRGSVVPPAAVRLAGTLPAIPGKADKFKPTDFSDLGSGFGADVGFSQELAPGLQAALRAIESADVSKIAALREQLAELLGLQSAGVGGAATAEAIDATRKALEELDPAAQKAAEQAQRLQDILSQTPGGALQSALQDIELINAAFAGGKISVDQWAQAVTVATQGLRGAGEASKKLDSFANDLGLTFSSAFEDAIVGGKSLRDVLGGLEQDLLRIITRKLVTEPLGNSISGFVGSGGGGLDIGSIFGKLFGGGSALQNIPAMAGDFGGGGDGGGFASLIGKFFSGFFADGGFLPPGRWGIAGERGPEPIFGGRTGLSVQPSRGMAGAMTVQQTFMLNGPADRRTQQQLAAAAARGLEAAARRMN